MVDRTRLPCDNRDGVFEGVFVGAAASQPISLEQFLAWEVQQESRFEFDGAHLRAMTGGTGAHAAIQVSLLRALANRLDGKPSRPYGSELMLKLESTARYPDAFVICSPVSPTATFATEPVVIFEILSKSSGSDDLGTKRLEYQAIPSLRRYVALAQSHRLAHVFHRTVNGWETELFLGAEAVLDMPEIEVALPMAEIYRGVVLEGDVLSVG